MSLESILTDVTAKLRQGRFPNEQSISQGIVLRVLNELDWDTYDTALVWPEFQTGEGRADLALCHPPTKPAIFMEVKPPGQAEAGVRQALDYAFHSGGVPMVVLTDGKTWSFYLTMEQGTYEERRVYKLDLFERAINEAASKLIEYLTHARVVSGESLEAARKEYRSRNRRSQAIAALPAAWHELVTNGDELLLELVGDAVESKAGVRPDQDDVVQFLASLSPKAALIRNIAPVPMITGTNLKTSQHNDGEFSRRGTLKISGKQFNYDNAKQAMVTVLNELARKDPTFLQRCAQHPNAQGRKRRYIAQRLEELYPDRPDLREHNEQLPGGWYVATNLNNQLKGSIIRLAAEVAGLKFGQDIVVDF